MSRFSRRLYYLTAFLVFAIIGPLLVAWTAGYRWSNIRLGFLRTGSLTVTSEPRATVRLNGISQGATPFRATHLAPGTYVMELSKPGLSTWRQEVAITQNVAVAIGPVMVYPTAFTAETIDAAGSILSTGDAAAAFDVTGHRAASTVRQVWPTSTLTTATLPWPPTSVSRSRTGQITIWQNATRAVVTYKNLPDQPWSIEPLTLTTFDPASEGIFYGQQAGLIVRYDTLTRQRTELTSGTSFTLVHDAIMFTQTVTGTTAVQRQAAYGQQTADTILTLAGPWVFAAGPPTTLLIRNTVTHELAIVDQSFSTQQYATTSLGLADAWWWTNADQPPLWLKGTELMTLNEKKQPQLLDRLSETPTTMAWVVPGHILWSISDHRLAITSVSARQGRGTLVEKLFDQPISLVGRDMAAKKVAITTGTDPTTITELGW